MDNPSVPEPKSTKFDNNKRSATRSNAAISIPQSFVDVAVVPTESSASQTFVQEPEETMCDYRGAFEISPSNGYTQTRGY